VAEVVTDEEGYFDVELEATDQPFSSPRQEVNFELLEPAGEQAVGELGEVVVRSPRSSFLVISDIDDTVVETEATNLLAMARATFLGNARSRTPFAGVGQLYRALVDGPSGRDENPLVFISRSPWNLYDLFDQFCDLQGIPRGRVFYLRDWGFSLEGLTRARARGHKFELIQRILDFEPDLPVILVGDSGQKDPEIYHAISEQYPGRLLGAFIRNVTKSRKRDESIRNLASEVREDGAVLYLADDSLQVVRKTADHGWIRREAIASVEAEIQAGHASPDAVDQLIDSPPAERSQK
jgi:phosphatidate phosphatase APP1